MSSIKSIIVIGASAGGLQAITALLEKIPAKLNLAIFVVLHVSRSSQADILVRHLQKKTSYTCSLPENGEKIEAGHVYIARPDFHMLLTPGIIRVIKGPHENRWRPSIDVLFRSAAASYNSKVTGIVLTGLLDDGTAGMSAIKRCGGTCIVQEPGEAEFPDMALNVLHRVEVDYRVPISDIGYILDDMNSKPETPETEVPEDIRIEADITEKMISDLEELKKIGEQSSFTCPDCGGTLFSIDKSPINRYRCFTGHVYTEELLLQKQVESLEESLWISIRKLEERKRLLEGSAHHVDESSGDEQEKHRLEKAGEMDDHIERLKSLLISLGKNDVGGIGYA